MPLLLSSRFGRRPRQGTATAEPLRTVVTPGLDTGIHSRMRMLAAAVTEWIAGSSPARTTSGGADGRGA
jgi:hypothetical protein